ncbi:MAG: disulfide bond formation protein B [Pseudomonadota bacterium]
MAANIPASDLSTNQQVTKPHSERLRLAALIGAGVAIATIVGAWAFELIGGLIPCPLCLTQRIPYYVGLPVAGLAVVLADRATGLARLALAAFGLIMIVSAGLGAYHSGVEWGWWPGPADCAAAAQADAALSIQDLRDQIEAAPHLVACDEAAWRLFGLSLAGWNVVASLAVAGVVAWGLRRS